MKVVAVLRLPKRGPKNGTPFLERGKCANTKGPIRNPDPILAPVSRNLAPSPVNFLSPQIRNKTWKTSLGKTTSCADFELAGAADQRAGNNKKQQQSCGIVRLCITPTSKQGLPAQLLQGARTSAYMRTCSELEPPCSFWLQLSEYDWMPHIII